MRRFTLLAALLVFVACGPTVAPTVEVTPSPMRTPLPTPTPTEVGATPTSDRTTPFLASPTRPFVAPPLVSLSYGDTTRHEWPVSASWTIENRIMIGDGVPNPGRTKPILAPVGADFILTAVGAPQPNSVRVTPYDVVNEQARFGEPYHPKLLVQIVGQQAIIRADLAPGDYLLDVLAQWEGGNRADYGFRVILSPR